MIGPLTNHLWQSTVFAIAAGLMTLAFRKNRAKVRYGLWLSASLKFLAPFSLLIAAGSQMHWSPGSQAIAARAAAPSVSWAVEQFSEPFRPAVPDRPPAASRDWRPAALFAVWLAGFASVAVWRWRAWQRVRAAVRASRPVEVPAAVETRMAPGLLEPGVIGFWHPVLLLPDGILERLTPSQLEAVLAHELCHVRRRDNLFAAVHMVVEAAFWFHPLVWWIGARMVEVRERACDEDVLKLGSEPRVYADAILSVCKLYLESPLACMPGVSGADIGRRIDAIMSNRMARQLNGAKKLLLTGAGVVALAAPIAIGAVRAQSSPSHAEVSRSVAAVNFDVASVKPCAPGDAGGRGGRNGGGSPGRLTEHCVTVARLIREAYVEFADGRVNFLTPVPMEGGPSWIDSERYSIEATAESAPSQAEMRGPMLQALLSQRFRLKIHSKSRQVAVYALSVAKGGTKLQATKEGSCVPFDPSLPTPYPQFCGQPKRGERGLHLIGASMTDLCKILSAPEISDRPVIDKTGLSGMFDIPLPTIGELRGGTTVDADGPPVSPFDGMRATVDRLGLSLVAAKGPGKFLVIDHVERPSEN